ncbi:hypothetical protein TM7_0004 [candidate division TM7 genomosp. GTL1]|nr:hypothetical protein TM7_0004 [candidate division TM7 genomosp. GTL1]
MYRLTPDPDREQTTDFFDFTIDPNLVARTAGVTIFNSDNDMDSIHKSVKLLHKTIPNIKYKEFHNYGHFCFEDMKTVEFPELVEEVLHA